MRMSIATTWDGQAVAPTEIAHLDAWIEADDLVVATDAPFGGDPPPPEPAGALWGLWAHEVVELFLLGTDERYLEIELGPHGHHLVLQLHGRRNVVRREIPIAYDARISQQRWTGFARMPRSLVPVGPLRANAYRVQGGQHFAHASVAPALDFHQLDRFVPFELTPDTRHPTPDTRP